MRRRGARDGVRARYAEHLGIMAGYAQRVGLQSNPFEAERLAVLSGQPVVVAHGYEIDVMPPYSGPWLLNRDGTVTSAISSG